MGKAVVSQTRATGKRSRSQDAVVNPGTDICQRPHSLAPDDQTDCHTMKLLLTHDCSE